MTTTKNRGQQLDAIMQAMDKATAAWVDAGYPFDGPEADAREAVFARLRKWNEAQSTMTRVHAGELLDDDGTHSVACECSQCVEVDE